MLHTYKLLFVPLLFLAINTYAQERAMSELVPVNRKHHGLREGKAIIYGNFLYKPNASSRQHIVLTDVNTQTSYCMYVKLEPATRKFNPFVFHIPAGTYAITEYRYIDPNVNIPVTIASGITGGIVGATVAKGVMESVGGKKCDHIFKYTAGKELQCAIDSNRAIPDTSRYLFTVDTSSLNYVGTWNFRSDTVSFENEKAQLDRKLTNALKKYQKLRFEYARTVIPN